MKFKWRINSVKNNFSKLKKKTNSEANGKILSNIENYSRNVLVFGGDYLLEFIIHWIFLPENAFSMNI